MKERPWPITSCPTKVGGLQEEAMERKIMVRNIIRRLVNSCRGNGTYMHGGPFLCDACECGALIAKKIGLSCTTRST